MRAFVQGLAAKEKGIVNGGLKLSTVGGPVYYFIRIGAQ
jgi:hypothetical protein